MIRAGDALFPLSGWGIVALPEQKVGLELSWPETAADLQTGQFKTVKVALSAKDARKLARVLMRDADAAEQMARPN